MPKSSALIIALALVCSACGTMPYREDFACALKDDYGKCINVAGAYLEAVTGIESHAPSLRNKGRSVTPIDASRVGGQHQQDVQTGSIEAYAAYRRALYSELEALLAAPETPMLRAPRTIRTLILSYEKPDDSKRLYMPRYVFTVVEEPAFVLGQYLDRGQHLSINPMLRLTEDGMPAQQRR